MLPNKAISDKINNIKARLIPFTTFDVWYPNNDASTVISSIQIVMHWNSDTSETSNINDKLPNHNDNAKPIAIPLRLVLKINGNGDVLTKWYGTICNACPNISINL